VLYNNLVTKLLFLPSPNMCFKQCNRGSKIKLLWTHWNLILRINDLFSACVIYVRYARLIEIFLTFLSSGSPHLTYSYPLHLFSERHHKNFPSCSLLSFLILYFLSLLPEELLPRRIASPKNGPLVRRLPWSMAPSGIAPPKDGLPEEWLPWRMALSVPVRFADSREIRRSSSYSGHSLRYN
jgi:hypothetical protein